MKTIPFVAFFLASMLQLSAANLDTLGYGEALHGWKGKKRIACYSLNNSTYRTHFPSITQNTSGGIFVSVKIDQGAGSSNVIHLDLTFAADGRLMIGQVKGTIAGKKG